MGGSSSTTQSAAAPSELREVDPERPVVRLRVQLLNKKPAQVVVNRDFTVQDLRGWLEHHQDEAGKRDYHLMDVTGFPIKKLTDLGATMEQLGLKSGCCLACRPA